MISACVVFRGVGIANNVAEWDRVLGRGNG